MKITLNWRTFVAASNLLLCICAGTLKCIPNNIYRRILSGSVAVSLQNPSRLPPCQLVAEKRTPDNDRSGIRTSLSNAPDKDFRASRLENVRSQGEDRLIERTLKTRVLESGALTDKTIAELEDIITAARSVGTFRGSRILNSAVEKSSALDNLSKLVGSRLGLANSKASLPAGSLKGVEKFLSPDTLKSLIGFRGVVDGIASNIGGSS